MRTRALIPRLLLALCLLFAQQVLAAHAAAHTAQVASQKDSTPNHAKLCEACVLSAQLHDALVGQAALLLDVRAPGACVARTAASHSPQPARSYRSRAPPARP
jgi:hypothetical protein